jgi:diamine N-acetyltransferase
MRASVVLCLFEIIWNHKYEGNWRRGGITVLRLEKITENNYGDCLNLKVGEDQIDFVSSNTLSLAKAYVFYDRVTPFAIYNDELMVGFIMLRFNEEYSSYFIWQFMIDERYQGKGYGSQAMKLAIELMKRDERCREIVTTYKAENEVARKLYTQLGFQSKGEIEEYNEVDMVLHF